MFAQEATDEELERLAFDFYIYAAATAMSTDEFIDYQREQAELIRTMILSDDTEASIAVGIRFH